MNEEINVKSSGSEVINTASAVSNITHHNANALGEPGSAK